MERLEPSPKFSGMAKYYEPTNTYEDPTSQVGTCVYKLKPISKKEQENMSDIEKDEINKLEYTIKLTHPLIP